MCFLRDIAGIWVNVINETLLLGDFETVGLSRNFVKYMKKEWKKTMNSERK
jgi:hypothetical protein